MYRFYQYLTYFYILILSVIELQCGAERALSGIWRQEPESNQSSTRLYELHLGQYGDRLTGLVLRYRPPQSDLLSLYDRGDRCDCAYIIQGKATEDIAFRLLNPSTTRVVSDPITCKLEEPECERIFDLREEQDELVGETWCSPSLSTSNLSASSTSPTITKESIRFVSIKGVPISQCKPSQEDQVAE